MRYYEIEVWCSTNPKSVQYSYSGSVFNTNDVLNGFFDNEYNYFGTYKSFAISEKSALYKILKLMENNYKEVKTGDVLSVGMNVYVINENKTLDQIKATNLRMVH